MERLSPRQDWIETEFEEMRRTPEWVAASKKARQLMDEWRESGWLLGPPTTEETIKDFERLADQIVDDLPRRWGKTLLSMNEMERLAHEVNEGYGFYKHATYKHVTLAGTLRLRDCYEQAGVWPALGAGDCRFPTMVFLGGLKRLGLMAAADYWVWREEEDGHLLIEMKCVESVQQGKRFYADFAHRSGIYMTSRERVAIDRDGSVNPEKKEMWKLSLSKDHLIESLQIIDGGVGWGEVE